MALKSKKKLFETLTALTGDESWQKQGLAHPEVINETYGKNSKVYVGFKTVAEREEMESKLERKGFPVNRRYWKGSSCTEVSVSYFKGYHWNE